MSEGRVRAQDQRRDHHAVFGPAGFQEIGRGLVPQSPRAEVGHRPCMAVFVGHQIHEMVAAADSPKLTPGRVFQRRNSRQMPGAPVRR